MPRSCPAAPAARPGERRALAVETLPIRRMQQSATSTTFAQDRGGDGRHEAPRAVVAATG